MELFRYNPRLYLGLNKVNRRIAQTIRSGNERPYFHLLNNGITAVCKELRIADAGPDGYVVHAEDFQVVNGCQTTITLFRNASSLLKGDCSVDVKIIESQGLRNLISDATNTQTAIYAEDAFSNEPEQAHIRGLLDIHHPPYFYSSKRGEWDRLSSAQKRRYLDTNARFGKYRQLTSKELAAVCLAVFGQPGAAKDRPRQVFEKQAGKNSPLYERVFQARNTAAQWLLPFELLRYATRHVKEEAEAERDVPSDAEFEQQGVDRARIGEYGRYSMTYLAYRYLHDHYAESDDFLSAATSKALLDTIPQWSSSLLPITLDALTDAFRDGFRHGEVGGLREFFRETKQAQAMLERFHDSIAVHARIAVKSGQTLAGFLGLPVV
jgi:hypothetical protein